MLTENTSTNTKNNSLTAQQSTEEEPFDPNKPCPNYSQRLKEHYTKIRSKTGTRHIHLDTKPRFLDNLNSYELLRAFYPKNYKEDTHLHNDSLKRDSSREATDDCNDDSLDIVLTDEERYIITSGQYLKIYPDKADTTTTYMLKLLCIAYNIDIKQYRYGGEKYGAVTKDQFVEIANVTQSMFATFGDLKGLRNQISKYFNKYSGFTNKVIARHDIDKNLKLKNFTFIDVSYKK